MTLFDSLMVFLKEFFEEVDFEKLADNKIMQNYTVGKSSVDILASYHPENIWQISKSSWDWFHIFLTT